ncbi:MAG: hypothetical protein RR310_08690 [Eubacterium sp.]
MKINMDKAVVEFIPENAIETSELEALWIKMGNCLGDDKKMSPIGVYIPTESNIARFHIGGLSEVEANAAPELYAPFDCKVYCLTCNKIQSVKAGELIPYCCSRPMEIMD